jgi:hypothetical protein
VLLGLNLGGFVASRPLHCNIPIPFYTASSSLPSLLLHHMGVAAVDALHGPSADQSSSVWLVAPATNALRTLSTYVCVERGGDVFWTCDKKQGELGRSRIS